MFCAAERGPEGDRLHIHSLIRAQDVHQERTADLWGYGLCDIGGFSSGAVAYCAKDIGPESGWGILGVGAT